MPRIGGIKKEIRIVGFDNGGTKRVKKVNLVGAVFRGGLWLEGLIKTEVETQDDVTERTVEALRISRHIKQLRVIMFNKVKLAGKEVNLQKVHEALELPVILVRGRPWSSEGREGTKAEGLQKVRITVGQTRRTVYVKPIGIDVETARKILENASIRKGFPEPLRVARLAAKAANSLR